MGLETMQQYLTSVFGDNKLAMYGALAVLALIILLVLWWGFRALFSGRVRAGGGRNRQPRLGVVDAYDLDRQRQLIIVRRDGVEHLVMIGGPNDVVIESGIVRVAVPSRERAERDMQNATGTFIAEARAGAQIPLDVALPVLKSEEHPAANLSPAPTANVPSVSATQKPAPEVYSAIVAPGADVVAVSPPAAAAEHVAEPAAPEPQRVSAPAAVQPAAVPKSILARVAGRIIPGASSRQEDIAPPQPMVLRQPQSPRPMENMGRTGNDIPTFAPRPPMEPAVAERAQPLQEPRVSAPEIMSPVPEFPTHKPETPAAPIHSAEDRELLKQLQSWVPKEVPAALEPVRLDPPVAAPVPSTPPAPVPRPALSTALPRPTFTPRTFTPMKPLNPPVKLPQPEAVLADAAVKPAETGLKQMPLDELEEEMARLLGRPAKIE